MKKYISLLALIVIFNAANAQKFVFVKCISGDCQNGTGVAEFEDQFFKNAGQVIYKGTFKLGKMSGEGILSTNAVYYTGSFEDNEYRGYGIEFYSKKVDGINVPDSSKTVSFGKWDTDGSMQAIQVWEEGRKSFYNTEGRSGHKKNFKPYKSFNDKWIEQHADAHIASRLEIFAAETARKAATVRKVNYENGIVTQTAKAAAASPETVSNNKNNNNSGGSMLDYGVFNTKKNDNAGVAKTIHNYKVYCFVTTCSQGKRFFKVLSKITADINKHSFDEIKNEAAHRISSNGWYAQGSMDYLGTADNINVEGKAGRDYAVSETALYDF